MKKIIVIGSTDAPYHPLSNLTALSDVLCEYHLIFTEDHDRFLDMRELSMLICYVDSWKCPLSNPQAASLKAYLETGGKILSIHNGISIQNTPGLEEITGAKYTHHKEYGKLLVQTAAGHPITDGIQDFYVFDEPYHFERHENLTILATYDYNGTVLPAAWEHAYGKGTLVYLMPGHDKAVFQCENYQKLIQNSVCYLENL